MNLNLKLFLIVWDVELCLEDFNPSPWKQPKACNYLLVLRFDGSSRSWLLLRKLQVLRWQCWRSAESQSDFEKSDETSDSLRVHHHSILGRHCSWENGVWYAGVGSKLSCYGEEHIVVVYAAKIVENRGILGMEDNIIPPERILSRLPGKWPLARTMQSLYSLPFAPSLDDYQRSKVSFHDQQPTSWHRHINLARWSLQWQKFLELCGLRDIIKFLSFW